MFYNSSAMPPFEFDNDDTSCSTSGLQNSSFLIEDLKDPLDISENLSVLSEHLTQGLPMDLAAAVKDLFGRAHEVVVQAQNYTQNEPILSRAFHRSVQHILAEVVDQVSLLVDLDEKKRASILGLAKSSIERGANHLNHVERLVQNPPKTKELAPFLKELQQIDATPNVEISLRSKPLALDFTAGRSDTAKITSHAADQLPLAVKVTPYLHVTMDDIASRNNLVDFLNIKVQLDSCSHRPTEAPSRSGIIGESLVRAYVTPANEEIMSKQTPAVWTRDGDTGRLGILEVRAVQKNAIPRMVQSKLDIFISSTFGSRGFLVTMKMKTFQSFNDAAPDMDIQMILQPPPMQI